MNNTQYTLSKTELQKAIDEGFVHRFEFLEGLLYCTLPPKTGHLIPACDIYPRPCIISETIVYRIITPDGIRGYAVLDFNQDE